MMTAEKLSSSLIESCKTANNVPADKLINDFKQGNTLQFSRLCIPEYFYNKARAEEMRKAMCSEIQHLSQKNTALTEYETILLGFGYETGVGVEEDPSKARQCYESLSKKNTLAHTLLGRIQEKEMHGDEALKCYTRAANKDNPHAMLCLMEFQEKYTFGIQFYEALDFLRRAADLQHPIASMMLGNFYIKSEPELGLLYFQKAASQGMLAALIHINHFTEVENKKTALTSNQADEWLQLAKLAEEIKISENYFYLGKLYKRLAEAKFQPDEFFKKSAKFFRMSLQLDYKLESRNEFRSLAEQTTSMPRVHFSCQFHYAAGVRNRHDMTQLAQKNPAWFQEDFLEEEQCSDVLPLLKTETASQVTQKIMHFIHEAIIKIAAFMPPSLIYLMMEYSALKQWQLPEIQETDPVIAAWKTLKETNNAARSQLFYLGNLYFRGNSVFKRNDKLAQFYYTEAATEGHFPALHRLAEFYSKGIATTPDPEHARDYYLLGAEHKDAYSMAMLSWQERNLRQAALHVRRVLSLDYDYTPAYELLTEMYRASQTKNGWEKLSTLFGYVTEDHLFVAYHYAIVFLNNGLLEFVARKNEILFHRLLQDEDPVTLKKVQAMCSNLIKQHIETICARPTESPSNRT